MQDWEHRSALFEDADILARVMDVGTLRFRPHSIFKTASKSILSSSSNPF